MLLLFRWELISKDAVTGNMNPKKNPKP